MYLETRGEGGGGAVDAVYTAGLPDRHTWLVQRKAEQLCLLATDFLSLSHADLSRRGRASSCSLSDLFSLQYTQQGGVNLTIYWKFLLALLSSGGTSTSTLLLHRAGNPETDSEDGEDNETAQEEESGKSDRRRTGEKKNNNKKTKQRRIKEEDEEEKMKREKKEQEREEREQRRGRWLERNALGYGGGRGQVQQAEERDKEKKDISLSLSRSASSQEKHKCIDPLYHLSHLHHGNNTGQSRSRKEGGSLSYIEQYQKALGPPLQDIQILYGCFEKVG